MARSFLSLFISILFTALIIAGCATTTFTASWKDPSYQRQPCKILVIGMSRKPVNKRIFEDEFVSQLKAKGTHSIASYTVMPDMRLTDHETIFAKMKRIGADAVLISRLTSNKTIEIHVPGSFYVVPKYYGNWRDYYAYGSNVMYTPGYMAEEELSAVETNLYDARNDRLIWSATSETEIMGSDLSQIKSYIGVMVSAMADNKLLR